MFDVVMTVVFGLLSLVLIIVSAATPAWLDNGTGIFINCVGTGGGVIGCTGVFGNEVISLVTAILCIVSATFALSAIIFFAVFLNKYLRQQGLTAATLYLFSALFAITAGIVYVAGSIDQTVAKGGALYFGYSFYLCWGSALAGLIACGFGFYAGAKGNEL